MGVPQSSVLWPILFSLYVNDVDEAFQTASFRIYADESFITLADTSETNLMNNCNSLLSNLNE